jgi:hypothetical protein
VKADTSVKEKYPVVKFEKCLKIISNYVNSKVDKPNELNQKTISAFSYYYDRATEYGLIGKCSNLGALYDIQPDDEQYG